MKNYIDRTIAAYKDTATYENSTSTMVPCPELNQFLGMLGTDPVILDAGCAYGRDTEYIQSSSVNVRGIDLSPDFIKRARELYPNIKFDVADVRSTGFDNDAYSGIWCHATLLHLNDEDMLGALQEFKRILRPNGILAVSMKKGEGTQSFIEAFSSTSERFFNFKTHDTFLKQLGRAGLQEVSWHYLNERERYGQNKRDLDWLYSFSKKPD